MKRLLTYIFVFLFLFHISGTNVQALQVEDNFMLIADCNEVLGSPDDPESTYTLLQQVFTILKFASPIMVLIFTVIEFIKATASQDKDFLTKAIKHTITRMIAGVIVFLLPTIFNFTFNILGWYGTCGIG